MKKLSSSIINIVLLKFLSFTVVSSTIFAVLTSVPISMTCMGFLYEDKCPMEPRIASYLYISGIVWLFTFLLRLWRLFAIEKLSKQKQWAKCIICVQIP